MISNAENIHISISNTDSKLNYFLCKVKRGNYEVGQFRYCKIFPVGLVKNDRIAPPYLTAKPDSF